MTAKAWVRMQVNGCCLLRQQGELDGGHCLRAFEARNARCHWQQRGTPHTLCPSSPLAPPAPWPPCAPCAPLPPCVALWVHGTAAAARLVPNGLHLTHPTAVSAPRAAALGTLPLTCCAPPAVPAPQGAPALAGLAPARGETPPEDGVCPAPLPCHDTLALHVSHVVVPQVFILGMALHGSPQRAVSTPAVKPPLALVRAACAPHASPAGRTSSASASCDAGGTPPDPARQPPEGGASPHLDPPPDSGACRAPRHLPHACATRHAPCVQVVCCLPPQTSGMVLSCPPPSWTLPWKQPPQLQLLVVVPWGTRLPPRCASTGSGRQHRPWTASRPGAVLPLCPSRLMGAAQTPCLG